MNPEILGAWVGFALTLMVMSYLLGDNLLYRIAIYAFMGLTAGYVTVVTVESVLLPWINGTVFSSQQGVGGILLGAVPLLLGALLLFKSSPRLARFGNLSIAFIISVGTAVALVGAITGTLIPLAGATSGGVRGNELNGLLVVLGTISVLVYFQYLARRAPTGEVTRSVPVRVIGVLGQGIIAITLGAVYGAAIISGLTAFSERVSYILARITGGG